MKWLFVSIVFEENNQLYKQGKVGLNSLMLNWLGFYIWHQD